MKIILFFIFYFVVTFTSQGSESNEWDNLLRIVSGKSEITEPDFFISKQNQDAQYEMQVLLEEITYENICKYPARYNYLNKKFHLNISFEKCDDLNLFLETASGDSLSIVFVTSHLNTPMSYFGHTFLKINKKGNRFFSQTISYAAEVPSGTGLGALISDGIGGGFNGRYQIHPYFKVYESYRAIEERGLVEYELNFTQDEIYILLLHLYEIRNIKQNYLYLSQNCAYEILRLLEVARPSQELKKELKKYVIPYDTVSILKGKGYIANEKYTPSVLSLIYSEYALLSSQGKKALVQVLKSKEKQQQLDDLDISEQEKDRLIFILTSYYDLLFKRKQSVPSDYNEVKELYYVRPNIESSFEYKYKYPSKLEFGLSNTKGELQSELKFTPVLFNKEEDYSSSHSMLTMEFFAFHLSGKDKDSRLESFSLVNLESFNNTLEFYYPLSWRVKIGAERFDGSLEPVLKVGIGYMTKVKFINTYFLVEPGTTVLDVPAFVNISYGMTIHSEKVMTGINSEINLISFGDEINNTSHWYLTIPVSERINLKFEQHFEDNTQKAYMIFRF